MRRNTESAKLCIFPEYKWCGPGCSGPGVPVNSVDAACRAHDLCYDRYGPTCECDRMFIKKLKTEINPHTRKGRHAFLFYQYMQLQTRVKCKANRCERCSHSRSWI